MAKHIFDKLISKTNSLYDITDSMRLHEYVKLHVSRESVNLKHSKGQ